MKKEKRIAWAITGAGHMLEECVEALLRFDLIDVFLSRAGEEVVRMYGLDKRLDTPRVKLYRESGASSPQVGRLFAGIYRVLVIAPATSNSVAKFVLGISDSLVSNLFAQAGKSRMPIVVYPTDLTPEVDSVGPHQIPVKVYPRPVDLENTRKLKAFAEVTLIHSLDELDACLSRHPAMD